MAALDAVTAHRAGIALDAISRRVQLSAAYLFGSRAEGRADEWSDFDLAIFIDGVDQWDLWQRARFCAAIQSEAGDDIELHLFPAEAVRSPEPASFARWIMDHGIRLPVEGRGT